MTETTREKYLFRVTTFHDGTPWIALDPLYRHLPLLKAGMLGFDLKPGTSHAKAEEIAAFLNEHIEQISYTA